jgi:hypothetical protein
MTKRLIVGTTGATGSLDGVRRRDDAALHAPARSRRAQDHYFSR